MSTPLAEVARATHLGFHDADTMVQQAQQMANRVVDALHQALAERGEASLAVSGGKSPAWFFQQLNQADLDWQHVNLTLADERWVPDSDPQSNAGLVQRYMPDVHRRARWLPLYQGLGLEADAHAVDARIRALLPLDVLILGVGDDGHTASLFPDSHELQQNLQADGQVLCRPVPAAAGRLARLTLTGAVLHHARVRLLQINGQAKREVVASAFGAEPEAAPIAAFLIPPLDIYAGPDFKDMP